MRIWFCFLSVHSLAFGLFGWCLSSSCSTWLPQLQASHLHSDRKETGWCSQKAFSEPSPWWEVETLHKSSCRPRFTISSPNCAPWTTNKPERWIFSFKLEHACVRGRKEKPVGNSLVWGYCLHFNHPQPIYSDFRTTCLLQPPVPAPNSSFLSGLLVGRHI